MKIRPDGSLQSANTPTYENVEAIKEDFALYRCMVTKVVYADDPSNVTKNSQNPEVLYEAVILGGFKSGVTITNIRKASWLGGDTNNAEVTLKAATKPLNNTRLSDQDGDVIYVMFVQGRKGFPVIIGMGKGIHDTNAATSATGPRQLVNFNGMTELIDNQGNWSLTQANGSTIKIAQGDQVEIQTKSGASVLVSGSGDEILVKDKEGATLKISGGKVGLGNSSAELVDILSQTLNYLANDLCNLGYPLVNSAQYAQLKTKVDGIKGGI